MTTWILILALYQPLDRLETLIPVAAPFASRDACWLAGYRVSQLEDLNLSSRPAAKRIAWECVPTTAPVPASPAPTYCHDCGHKLPGHVWPCPEGAPSEGGKEGA